MNIYFLQTTDADPEGSGEVSKRKRCSSISSSSRRHQIHATNEIHVEWYFK